MTGSSALQLEETGGPSPDINLALHLAEERLREGHALERTAVTFIDEARGQPQRRRGSSRECRHRSRYSRREWGKSVGSQKSPYRRNVIADGSLSPSTVDNNAIVAGSTGSAIRRKLGPSSHHRFSTQRPLRRSSIAPDKGSRRATDCGQNG